MANVTIELVPENPPKNPYKLQPRYKKSNKITLFFQNSLLILSTTKRLIFLKFFFQAFIKNKYYGKTIKKNTYIYKTQKKRKIKREKK